VQPFSDLMPIRFQPSCVPMAFPQAEVEKVAKKIFRRGCKYFQKSWLAAAVGDPLPCAAAGQQPNPLPHRSQIRDLPATA
jgi:hypothetical protein